MAGDLTISTINGGAIGAKNALINGNFGINQRAVSGTVTLSAGAYGHDRFKAGASGCTYTFTTSNNITTLTITAGSLIQVIEGVNLQSGTYTLSWTGTAQGKIGGGSYAGSGVTGTVTGGTNLNIEFDTGTLSLVQLEAGSVATPFEHRLYGQELALCQRYYYRTSGGSIGARITQAGYAINTTVVRVHNVFPVAMRVAPTAMEQSGTAADYSVTGFGTIRIVCSAVPTIVGAQDTHANTNFTVASGLTAWTAGACASSTGVSTATAYLAWSTEL